MFYTTFVISTCVISIILALILKSYSNEKKRLDKANLLPEEKMEILNCTNLKLQKALDQVKTLKGLLLICSHCKKIRDDKGYWNEIEAYLGENSEAEFSHGICQECAEKYYPEMDLYGYE